MGAVAGKRDRGDPNESVLFDKAQGLPSAVSSKLALN